MEKSGTEIRKKKVEIDNVKWANFSEIEKTIR